MRERLIIAVDFDGTCVTHEYPNIGKDIGAAPVLKWLTNQGHRLVLWTMRSGRGPDKQVFSKELNDAVEWFIDNSIPLYGVNMNPSQYEWSRSPKAYANIYIDDAALGCPLKFDESLSSRPFVDWGAVKVMLERILNGETLVGHTDLVED